ncbi:heme exporter protein A [Natronospira proteinivora]|uniref:Heme exporter protein A n=1 Tax=Natronospira proteinivora TaxID=1807133 RepID=A0ABT1G934_9GAMM|nr:cytochrome c biogenesis heme-transporting ATPase CcmA [Natronospira proteinivora]MCP1726818.1 heme exporter protein A [Natronospira proteinivora]
MSQSVSDSTSNRTTSLELRAHGLEIWRGETCLFHDFSLNLQAGETVWLRGPNGIGKTTLMRVLLGLSHPEAGEISWCGRSREVDLEAFRREVAWLGHQTGIRGELTPRENLAAWQPLMGHSSECSLTDALSAVGLSQRADQPCQTLSAGQNRRVAMARLLMDGARLWFLDEPLTSLDAQGQDLIGQLVASHRAAGGAALVSSHQPLPASAGTARILSLDEAVAT